MICFDSSSGPSACADSRRATLASRFNDSRKAVSISRENLCALSSSLFAMRFLRQWARVRNKKTTQNRLPVSASRRMASSVLPSARDRKIQQRQTTTTTTTLFLKVWCFVWIDTRFLFSNFSSRVFFWFGSSSKLKFGKRQKSQQIPVTFFFTLPFGIASFTATTIISPILAYLLLDPPRTLIHSILLAPVLSLIIIHYVFLTSWGALGAPEDFPGA